MFFAPTTDQEVGDVILNLKNTSSMGDDNIPLHIVTSCEPDIVEVLTHIINTSMAEGTFPDTLRIAEIIPVFKSGDSKSISNYRPISILTSFSKIVEKIIAVRLRDYINHNNILNERQFGFRTGLSTCMAL